MSFVRSVNARSAPFPYDLTLLPTSAVNHFRCIFTKRTIDEVGSGLAKDADVSFATKLEKAMCEGIQYGVLNPTSSTGPIDVVILSQSGVRKQLVQEF